MSSHGGAMMISPLQVCLDKSNWCEVGWARLLCQSMTKKPNIRHTHIEAQIGQRLED